MTVKTINSVKSENQILKYQRFTPLGCKDIKFKTICIQGECLVSFPFL